MNEREWLKSADPKQMLVSVSASSRARKLRLFATACSRRVWDLLAEERWKKCVEAAEQFADGQITGTEMQEVALVSAEGPWDVSGSNHWDAASSATHAAFWPEPGVLSKTKNDEHFRMMIVAAQDEAASAEAGRHQSPERSSVLQKQAILLRDIFGNPFRPVTLDPRWQSSTVLDLARTIYDERRPENMPILADALMDAGCDSEEILAHCRNGGPHVRGCWVVDLLLGKT